MPQVIVLPDEGLEATQLVGVARLPALDLNVEVALKVRQVP
jgi:hypothetical protein